MISSPVRPAGASRPVRVYISGPYSADPERCTRDAIAAADRLLRLGFAPLVPHLKHAWIAQADHSYEDWLRLDLAWVQAADVLLRLPGASPGADREVACARACDIPVMPSIGQLLAWSGRPADNHTPELHHP